MSDRATLEAIRDEHDEAVWERYDYPRPPTLMHTGRCVADEQPHPCPARTAAEIGLALADDADRLAEALRGSPMVVGDTATEATAHWETERMAALKAHDAP
jgi:hypothetical protein